MRSDDKTQAEAFVARLKEHFKEPGPGEEGQQPRFDRAGRAVLRRHAGKTLAESRRAWQAFYRLHPPPKSEEDAFVLASLFCLARGRTGPPLGKALRNLDGVFEQKRLERRLLHLVDCARGRELAFRLGQVVRLLATHGKGVDWAELFRDLRSWASENRWRQKRWIADFYGTTDHEQEKTDAV